MTSLSPQIRTSGRALITPKTSGAPPLSFSRSSAGWRGGRLAGRQGAGKDEGCGARAKEQVDVECGGVQVLAGTRGPRPHHTTSPPTQKHNVAAGELLPDRAHFPQRGFIELPRVRAGPRAKREESTYGPMSRARATRHRQYQNHSPGGMI